MNSNINNEVKNIEDINRLFENITDNTLSISAITEEQISKTNEILISQRNPETQINCILNSANEVDNECNTLNKLLH
ncbi:MAG: hypothetical protein K5986_10880 [Clostridium sp.]|nr:hypothetical protein [Clostridium sp.]